MAEEHPSIELHEKAALHHEEAAKHHKAAVSAHKAQDHNKAKESAHKAREHSALAHDHGVQAAQFAVIYHHATKREPAKQH